MFGIGLLKNGIVMKWDITISSWASLVVWTKIQDRRLEEAIFWKTCVVLKMYETQRSLMAAFPFGGYIFNQDFMRSVT